MKTCILFVIMLFVTDAFGQKVSIKDNVGNILMEVNDEGTTGSIVLPGFFSPSVTTNKIYNAFGQLYWNGTKLGTAIEAAGWTLSGLNLYPTNASTMVGIGTTTPASKLHVQGSSTGEIALSINNLNSTGSERLYFGSGVSDAGFLVFGPTHASIPGKFRFLNNYPNGYFDWVSGSAVRMTLDENGQLAIGPSSPTQKLDVDGKVRIGDDGITPAAGVLRYNSTDDAFEGHDGSGWNALTNKWLVNAAKIYYTNGNVGIGTSGPSTLLHVQDNTTGVTTLTLHNTDDSGSERLFFGTSTGTDAFIQVYGATASSNTGKFRFLNNRTGANFDWVVDGSLKMILNNDGNLGIGTNSPTQKLDVAGKVKIGDDGITPAAGVLRYNSTDDEFQGHDGSAWRILTNKWLANANKIYYTNGNVGIGTSSPSTLLHVQDNTTGVVTMTLHNVDDSGSERLFFGTSTSSDAFIQVYGSTASQPGKFRLLNNRTSANFDWVINGSARMILDNNGNLGIGTTAPTEKLHVNGRILVGSDSVDLTLEPGTIRFNPNTNDFEGYNGQWVSLTNSSGVTGHGTVTDIDGNIYRTATIETQTWIRENLRTSKYNDGTPIGEVLLDADWDTTDPAWSWYDNNHSHDLVYGKLYNWYAIDSASNGNKNVCPVGWHVPSHAEWTILTDTLGGAGGAGGKMTETGVMHWINPPNSTNESGFTALPGGYRTSNGTFELLGGACSWWSSTATSTSQARSRDLYGDEIIWDGPWSKKFGFSVRCLKD